MKKNISKSLQPQAKSLFRFKNSDTKIKGIVMHNGDNPPQTSDATITTTIVVTL